MNELVLKKIGILRDYLGITNQMVDCREEEIGNLLDTREIIIKELEKVNKSLSNVEYDIPQDVENIISVIKNKAFAADLNLKERLLFMQKNLENEGNNLKKNSEYLKYMKSSSSAVFKGIGFDEKK